MCQISFYWKDLIFIWTLTNIRIIMKQKRIHPQNFLIILISARSLSISLEYHCTGTMSWNLLSLKEGRVLFLWTLISVWFTVEILLLFPLDVSMPSNRMILLKWNMKILFSNQIYFLPEQTICAWFNTSFHFLTVLFLLNIFSLRLSDLLKP